MMSKSLKDCLSSWMVFLLLATCCSICAEAGLRGGTITLDEEFDQEVPVHRITIQEHTQKDKYIIALQESNDMTSLDYEERMSNLCLKHHLVRGDIYGDIHEFSVANVTLDDVEEIQNDPSVLFLEPDAIITMDTVPNHFVSLTNSWDEDEDEEEESLQETKTTEEQEETHDDEDADEIYVRPVEVGEDQDEDVEQGSISINSCGGQTIPWNVKRVGYRNAGGSTKKVFVVDTGVAKLTSQLNINTSLSKNFVGSNRNKWADCNGHGTHIAGTIGAKTGCGVVGVAPGAKIVAIRVLDCYGGGEISTVVKAVNYIAGVGRSGDVVNISMGGSMPQRSLELAIQKLARKGMKVVLSAGNDGRNASYNSPGRMNANNVYTVCALNKNNRVASFSNFGKPPVDWCAPGEGVLSLSKNGGKKTMSGTSMAAPHVAALLYLGRLRTKGQAKSSRDGKSYPIAGL